MDDPQIPNPLDEMERYRKATKWQDTRRLVSLGLKVNTVLYNQLLRWSQSRNIGIKDAGAMIIWERIHGVVSAENLNQEVIGFQAKTIYEQRAKLKKFAKQIKEYQTKNGEEEKANWEAERIQYQNQGNSNGGKV